MSLKRFAAVVMVATTLAAAGVPASSYARRGSIGDAIGKRVGRETNAAAGRELALISVGITAGVAALVGGAIWYYRHHRHTAAKSAKTAPPTPEATPN